LKSVSATLATAQSAAIRTPYFDMVFKSIATDATVADYSGTSSHIEEIRHIESAYGGSCTVILNNNDRSVPDLRGTYVEIGYGDVTSGGNETSASPRLWVRSQEWNSAPGVLLSTVELVDGFTRLSEILAHPGTAPYWYGLWNKDTTVFDILDDTIVDAGFTITAWAREPATHNHADAGTDTTTIVDADLISTADDFYNDWTVYNSTRALYSVVTNYVGSSKTLTISPAIAAQTTNDEYAIYKTDEIISTFKPYFEVNADNSTGASFSWEDSLSVCYRLIMMTKSYLRAKPTKTFEVVFPRIGDAADITFYDNTPPYFYDFKQKQNETIPNCVYVYGNGVWNDITGVWDWTGVLPGYSADTDAITRNGGVEIPAYYAAPTLLTQVDVDKRAAAILTRIRAETLSVNMVVPHDCRIELYDNVQVSDARGI
jgi:hypothetical protein